MSAQSNITVYDGQNTPVSHTFIPVGVYRDDKTGEDVAVWREDAASIPEYALSRITFRSRKNVKTGMWRQVVQVEVPVMESISGQNAAGYTAAPKVAYVVTDTYVVNAHERSTYTERKLVRGLLSNLSNNVTTTNAIATSGPFQELTDRLIAIS